MTRTSITPSPVQRASATDRAFLAMDTGAVPAQFGVVLELDGHLDLVAVQELVSERIRGVPRLRQRLVGVPFGLGGPIWVDDPAFDVRRHVLAQSCRPPGDEQALADAALDAVVARLPRDRPLWSVRVVQGLQADRSALVVVLHHVLADGVGGLAVLGSLVDPGPASTTVPFPRPRPAATRLLADTLAAKARSVAGLRRSWRLLRASTAAGGGLRPPRIEDCTLMRPTGPRRRVVVVHTDHEAVRAAAHRHGATTNDAVLVALCAALGRVLEGRGERVDTLVVTVPVSGRGTGEGASLGNQVSPMLVPVPTTGPLPRRLADVAATVRAGRAGATGPPPIGVLGWLFRPVARAGGYRWYMTHQRRFHTLVSHVRGPAAPLSFGGRRIVSAVPLGVAENGNSTVGFEVLSYAGTLTVAALVDPDHFPDAGVLQGALADELRAVSALEDRGAMYPGRRSQP